MTSTPSCALCAEPLLIPSQDSTGPSTIPDDVHLVCNCHFHWDCITEHFEELPSSSRSCPACKSSVLSRDGRFLVDVRNEGGYTAGYDLGDDLDEDQRDPEEVRKERFFALVSQGDYEEAELFLRGDQEGGDGEKVDVNAVGDGEGQLTALHVAAFAGSVEGVKLLLKYGARCDVRAKDGATPVDCARIVGAHDVVNILLSA
ncbi:hypothetical protein P7C70_g8495, partial [Phenoliferia sp. Uapishka_3]